MVSCSFTLNSTDGCTHRSVTNPPGARSRVTVKGGTLEVDIPRGPLFSTERAGTAGFALVLLNFEFCLLPGPCASAGPACLSKQKSLLHDRCCCGLSHPWALSQSGAQSHVFVSV